MPFSIPFLSANSINTPPPHPHLHMMSHIFRTHFFLFIYTFFFFFHKFFREADTLKRLTLQIKEKQIKKSIFLIIRNPPSSNQSHVKGFKARHTNGWQCVWLSHGITIDNKCEFQTSTTTKRFPNLFAFLLIHLAVGLLLKIFFG